PPGTPVITQVAGVSVQAPFFNENAPAPSSDVPLVNDVAGALEIQEFLERVEWLGGAHAPGAFAVYLRSKPLDGVPVRPILIQMARGDRSHVNPSTAYGIQAGGLADRVTMYRHDLFPQNASFKNPHTFVVRTDNTVMKGI